MPVEMKRLKQLDEENQQLKKLADDLSLDKELLTGMIRRSEVLGAETVQS